MHDEQNALDAATCSYPSAAKYSTSNLSGLDSEHGRRHAKEHDDKESHVGKLASFLLGNAPELIPRIVIFALSGQLIVFLCPRVFLFKGLLVDRGGHVCVRLDTVKIAKDPQG